MSGNFSAKTNSQTGFSAATRRSLPQHARLGTASSLTRPALPQSEPASGPSSIMIKGGWYKTEVVERIAANRCGDLIRDTRSCTRVHDMTNFHPHCGRCSQCLDRRFAILAAGQEQEDPEEAYKVDLFSGDRQPGLDQEMALAFVRSVS